MLEPIAKNGSPEAQLIFAINAESLINIARFNGLKRFKDEELSVMKLAESYGTSAAQSGLEEAYWFMARAYYTRLFGERDFVKAYAFTLPLSKITQPDDVQERLDFLCRELTMPKLKQAQKIATGCQIHQINLDSAANPFARPNEAVKKSVFLAGKVFAGEAR